MRILFLTNFYPPHEIGGQERSCQQVVEGLRQRGHDTLVLTSMHGANNRPAQTDNVRRALHLEMDLTPWRHSINFFTERKRRERHNVHTFAGVLSEFQPEIIFIWGMWNLSWSLPAMAEARLPNGVVYRFAEYWPTLPTQHEFYWRAPGRNWYSRVLKNALGRVALAILAREGRGQTLHFRHTICVSAATRDKLVASGVPVAQARIIHTGVEAGVYPNGEGPRGEDQTLKLLFAGRLAADKGVETAIQALAELISGGGPIKISLTLAGSGSEDYTSHLRQLVDRLKLDEHVTFLGWVRHEEMAGLMQKYDVLLVPSIWPEPFARVVLEGMVAGLVVVATPAGGTSEIVRDGENGLLFTPGDSHDLAAKIGRLLDDVDLRHRLAEAGWQTIANDFNLSHMIDQYEDYLQEVAHAAVRNDAKALLQ
jgi:glycosyltransferase involved in cell wall biosynthesis